MANVNAAINEQIRRLARREVRSGNQPIKRATAQYRRAIAALKRQVAQLTKQVGDLRKQVPGQPKLPPPEVLEKARLRTDGLRAHRARLGLSAKDYGRLLGVSALTVYSWEKGKSRPRRSQLPRILAARGMGKREAWERLGFNGGGGSDGEADVKAPRRRGVFTETAAEMLASLLQKKRTMTSGEINAVWKKTGRLGNADNTLSLMTKARKLKRAKLKGERGSAYRLA